MWKSQFFIEKLLLNSIQKNRNKTKQFPLEEWKGKVKKNIYFICNRILNI